MQNKIILYFILELLFPADLVFYFGIIIPAARTKGPHILGSFVEKRLHFDFELILTATRGDVYCLHYSDDLNVTMIQFLHSFLVTFACFLQSLFSCIRKKSLKYSRF